MDRSYSVSKKIQGKHLFGLYGFLRDHFKKQKPQIITEERAEEEINDLYDKLFPTHKDDISEKEFRYFKREILKRFERAAGFKNGDFAIYAFLQIDTGKKTERTPNLEWYDWDFSFYYLPEEDDDDMLKDIPDEPALLNKDIRNDRMYLCNFLR